MNGVALLLMLALASCAQHDGENRVVGQLASDRVLITVESSEPILAIPVKEGERVIAGQLLLVQDDRRAKARFDEADAALAEARAHLDERIRGPREEQIRQARADTDRARHDLEFRRAELDRIRAVFERRLISPDAVDQAQNAHDTARSTLAQRNARLEELLAGTTVEELAQVEHAVRQAAARRESASIDVERHRILAPVDGLIDTRLYEPGERPPAGQAVLVLLTGAQAHAEVFVPESSRASIRVGTAAEVFVDGLDEPVPGVVRWVASESAFTPYYALTERDRGRLSFLAKIDLPDNLERLPEGVPVEARFLLD